MEWGGRQNKIISCCGMEEDNDTSHYKFCTGVYPFNSRAIDCSISRDNPGASLTVNCGDEN